MASHLKMPPLVCIFLSLSRKAVRDKLHGILRYERMAGSWRVYLQDVSEMIEPLWSRFHQFDGIIADISGMPELDRSILAAGVPTVFVDHSPFSSRKAPLCFVNSDGEAIGRMGAEHLISSGFTHFGFVDSDDSTNPVSYHSRSPNNPTDLNTPFYSLSRRTGFVERLQEEGYSCFIYSDYFAKRQSKKTNGSLQAWLRELPKPIGIMSAWDSRGHQVISSCQNCGFRVPEDVAVLGVDNDEVICQASKPTLSSIVTDNENGGFLAAQMLDKLLRGENLTSKVPYFYKPLYVYNRRSTAYKPDAEPFIREALDFIEAYAGTGINVADIVKQLKISRRLLEMRFREVMGHSILEEIHLARFQRARYLLLETELSSGEIAKLCGYENVHYFYKAFKKMTGKTTTQFRNDRG